MKKLVGIVSILFLLTTNKIHSTLPSTPHESTDIPTIGESVVPTNLFTTEEVPTINEGEPSKLQIFITSFAKFLGQLSDSDTPDKALEEQLQQLSNDYKDLRNPHNGSLYFMLVARDNLTPFDNTPTPLDATIIKNMNNTSLPNLLKCYTYPNIPQLLNDTIPHIRYNLAQNSESPLLDEVGKAWNEFPYTEIGVAYVASKILSQNSISKNPKLALVSLCGLAIYMYTNYTMKDVLRFSLQLGILYSIATLGQYTADAAIFS